MQRSLDYHFSTRGASLVQESGLWVDLQKVFIDTPITKRRSIIAPNLHNNFPNSAPFARTLIRQNTVHTMQSKINKCVYNICIHLDPS